MNPGANVGALLIIEKNMQKVEVPVVTPSVITIANVMALL